jgi:hypothetical protein
MNTVGRSTAITLMLIFCQWISTAMAISITSSFMQEWDWEMPRSVRSELSDELGLEVVSGIFSLPWQAVEI